MSSRWTRFPAVGLVALLLICAPELIGQERTQGPTPGAPQAAAGDQDTRAKAGPEGDRQPGTAAAVPPPSAVQPGPNTISQPMPASSSGGSQWPSAVIREPSQGRPIFRAPGETFYFVMRLPRGVSGDVSFTLQLAQEPAIRTPLRPTTPPS